MDINDVPTSQDKNFLSFRRPAEPGMEHNSSESKPSLLTPVELRARYVRDILKRHTLPPHWRAILLSASCEDLTLADIKVLIVNAAHADHKGENAYQSNRTVAVITGLSERAVKRSNGVLQGEGWLVIQRRRRDNAVRAVTIPKNLAAALRLEAEAIAALGLDLMLLMPSQEMPGVAPLSTQGVTSVTPLCCQEVPAVPPLNPEIAVAEIQEVPKPISRGASCVTQSKERTIRGIADSTENLNTSSYAAASERASAREKAAAAKGSGFDRVKPSRARQGVLPMGAEAVVPSSHHGVSAADRDEAFALWDAALKAAGCGHGEGLINRQSRHNIMTQIISEIGMTKVRRIAEKIRAAEYLRGAEWLTGGKLLGDPELQTAILEGKYDTKFEIVRATTRERAAAERRERLMRGVVVS